LKKKLREMYSGPQYIPVLRTFYKAGGRDDLAALCVMKQRRRVIQPDELLSFPDVVSLIRVCTTKRNAALVGCLWDTGGRITEVLSSDLGDTKRIPPSEGQPAAYRLWFRESKTEVRYGWITDTEKALGGWIKAHPFSRDPKAPLFCNADGSRLSRKRAWAIVTSAARKVTDDSGNTIFTSGRRPEPGKKKVWPHLFRHSRATDLLRKGLSEADVKKLLGWSPRSTQLARYGHLTSGDAYRALLRAEGFTPPPTEKSGRVTLDDDALVQVLPVIPSGAKKTPFVSAEVASLLEDPKVKAFVLALGAMKKTEL
jgi:integrase